MKYEPYYYIQKYRKAALIVVSISLALLTISIVSYNIHLTQQRRGKIAVPVQVVPEDATVKLSNGQYLSTGTAYVAPGEYTVAVSKPGYETRSRTLRVSDVSKPVVYIGLSGKTKEAKQWQKNNQSDYAQLATLTVERGREYGALFKSNNPIIDILPIKDPYYTVDYRNYDDKTIELIIYGVSPRYRQAAFDFLRSEGYEPTDYRISYDNFDNPLEGDN